MNGSKAVRQRIVVLNVVGIRVLTVTTTKAMLTVVAEGVEIKQ